MLKTCVWHVLPAMGEAGRQTGRVGGVGRNGGGKNKFSDVPCKDTNPLKSPYSQDFI